MQDTESILSQKSKISTNPMLLTLLNELDKAVVYSNTGNVTTNQKLWENYSKEWQPNEHWVQKMAENVCMGCDIQALGDEWAPRKDTQEIIDMFIKPNISSSSNVIEIGVGGGRIAREVVAHVSQLTCYDISTMMLKRAREAIPEEHRDRVSFHCLDTTLSLGEWAADNSVDFMYSFDVFPHVDLHVMLTYFREAQRVLRPGGQFFFSTSDMTSPGGWERFSRQKSTTVGGFCWTSPDAVLSLVERAGLKVAARAQYRADNVYLHRDLLLVVQKPD